MAVGRRSAGTRAAIAPMLLAVVVGWFLFEAREPRAQIDDAYISYQYARNFVEGRGLVFNPGEYVEGYSNTLWTLLVAVGVALGGDAASVGWLLGVLGGAGALVVTYTYARAVVRREHAWQAVVAAGVVASATSFAVWSVQGLETALFAALVTA